MLHHVGVPHFFHQGMASKTTSWGQSFGAGKSQIPRIFGGENGKGSPQRFVMAGWITWKWWEAQVLAQFQVNGGGYWFVSLLFICLLIGGQGQEMRIFLQECKIPILPCPYQSLNLGRRNDSADGETNFVGDPR